MPPVKVPNYCSKWNKPPTSVYEDNYGYGINFYQPMIDYISDKEHGGSSKPPHLPWNNERGLDKYRFDKAIKPYSEEDVSRISKDIAESAKRELNVYKVGKRSPFSVVATAAAANVTKHVGVENVASKGKKKQVTREKFRAERQKKRMEEIDRELELYEKAVNVGSELRGKAMMYRGKSAKAIAQVLLDESRKNVAQSRVRSMDLNDRKEQVDRRLAKVTENIMSKASYESKMSSSSDCKLSEQICETIRTVRATSPVSKCVIIRTEVPVMDYSYVEKINELKETIKQFESLNTYMSFDHR